MVPEEWPIAASAADRKVDPAHRAGRDRLSTVRLDFFLNPEQRLSEQERLMLRTCEAFEQQAQQLRQLGDRTQDMIRSREFQRDRDTQRDMDRLRQHLNTMATELDGSLKLMERLQQRLHVPAVP